MICDEQATLEDLSYRGKQKQGVFQHATYQQKDRDLAKKGIRASGIGHILLERRASKPRMTKHEFIYRLYLMGGRLYIFNPYSSLSIEKCLSSVRIVTSPDFANMLI